MYKIWLPLRNLGSQPAKYARVDPHALLVEYDFDPRTLQLRLPSCFMVESVDQRFMTLPLQLT